MAGLRKDVELIFRGEDRASPTIKKVRDNVSGLADAIDKQIAAADRGEGSIDDLAKAYRSLKDAQGDIGEIVKLASAYEKQTQALAEQNRKVEEARQKEAQLAAQIAAAEKPTKRLTASREAAERQLAGAIAKQEQLAANVRELGSALDAAGGDSNDFAATQDRIRQAAIETARAIRDAAAAMDQFKGKQAQGRAGLASQEEALAFNQMAAGSGLPQAQIQFISTLENRLEALGQAIREDQASMAALNREFQDRSAADAASRVAAMSRAMDEADAAAARLRTTMQFRQMAAEIEAGARDISRFGAQTDTAAVSTQRLADTIQAILQPTQAAAGNLQKVSSILDAAEASLTGNKKRLSEYNDELNNLGAAQAGLSGIARNIDAFRQQEAALAAATQEMNAAQGEVLQLAAAIRTSDEPTKEMASALQQAEAALERTGAAVTREASKLKTLENALEQAGVDVRNLDSAQEQLISSSTRLANAQQRISGMTKGRGNFLGLNSAEITQLGYQVNDVIVSLVSGQNPLMVFTQQGAQIGQIIPGAFAKIIKFAGPLAALAAVLVTLGLAIKKTADESRRLEMGQGLTAQMGDGVATTAEDFAALATSLEKAGLKADEVRGKLEQLAADGLSTDQMQAYVDTATALAEVTGVDVSEALQTIRDHFQGGLEDILELDAATNAFTDSEIALIEQLYEQGRADEARATALAIYQNKMTDIAAAQEGPWKRAVDSLSSAWQNFLGWISASAPFEAARRRINDIAVGAAYLAEVLNQLSSGKGFDHNAAAKKALGIKAPSSAAPAVADPNRRTSGGRRLLAEGDRELRTVKATTREQRLALEVEKARNDAAKEGLSNREAAEYVAQRTAIFNAEEDKKDAKRATAAGKRADAAARKKEAAARRAAKAAETEARKIASAEEQLQRQLESLDAKVAKRNTESLETRLSAIDSEYAKLFRSIDEYEAQTGGKGLIGGRSIADAREHVRLQQIALKNYETMEHYEERINDLEKERKEKLDEIADQVARGIITPEQGLVQSKGVIDDMAVKINDMAQAALAFALAIRGAKPDPALDALIASFRTAIQNNSGGQNAREYQGLATKEIEAGESRLNQIIAHRNELVEHENLLVELGLQNRSQAQRKIETHYASTAGLIRQQIAEVRRLAAAYGQNLTPEMEQYFKALEARLQGVELQTSYVDGRFQQLKQGFDQIISGNIVSFIESVAQAFANLATQKASVMDTLASIGMAFLDMIAKTLQGIAMLIIQMIILDAVDKMTGGLVKPLLKLYGGAGVFHEGGVVGDNGSSSRTRRVSPLAFAGAPRYHTGGIAGLAPNETAAILKKGEEVLTEADPRHRANGGLTPEGGGQQGIRQVLAVGDDEIAGAMSGAAGEKTVITHIRRNKASIKQLLDS